MLYAHTFVVSVPKAAAFVADVCFLTVTFGQALIKLGKLIKKCSRRA